MAFNPADYLSNSTNSTNELNLTIMTFDGVGNALLVSVLLPVLSSADVIPPVIACVIIGGAIAQVMVDRRRYQDPLLLGYPLRTRLQYSGRYFWFKWHLRELGPRIRDALYFKAWLPCRGSPKPIYFKIWVRNLDKKIRSGGQRFGTWFRLKIRAHRVKTN